MIDPRTVLVAGDADERRARETYGAWMVRGREVVTALAERPERPGWPDDDPPDDLPASRWTRRPYPDRTAVDAALAQGWLVAAPPDDIRAEATGSGPLRGLAAGVKDIIDVAGMPTRNGTSGAAWREPTDSADCWSALAGAGARCVGKAATHEMAWGVTTPQIANPLAADRIAGGSSGGSAAAVASGAAHGALGTDTGGSIR
ncbi:MAG: amidase family protein, partial [Nocardioidaceae bacterium]